MEEEQKTDTLSNVIGLPRNKVAKRMFDTKRYEKDVIGAKYVCSFNVKSQ